MKTKEITKGALLSALIALFALSFIYLPFLSYFGMFFGVCAVAILLTYVDSVKVSVTALAVAMILIALFSDFLTMLYSGVLMIVVPGTIMGICLRKKLPFSTLMILSGVAYVVSIMGTFLLSKLIYGIDFITEFQTILEQSVASVVSMIEAAPQLADGAAADQLLKTIPALTETMMLTIPSSVIIAGAFLALCSALFSRGILRRLDPAFSYLPSFSQLHIPRSVAWGYLLITLAEMLVMENRSLYFMLYNGELVMSAILLVGGISLIKYLINKIKAPKMVLNLFLLVLLPFVVVLSQIVVLAGMIDALWDFRNPRRFR